MLVQPHSRFVFIGDSITNADRAEAGEMLPHDPWVGLGRGYVSYIHALLASRYPAAFIKVSNRGIIGDGILDLLDRWNEDVIELKPNWLTVFVGINDVWRHFDSPTNRDQHVSLDTFETVYTKLLEQTRRSLDGLILVTPYVVEEDPKDKMRVLMAEYAAIVEKLADKFDALLVDSQSAVDQLTDVHHPTAIAWDRIHMGPAGHMSLARALLDAIGFDW